MSFNYLRLADIVKSNIRLFLVNNLPERKFSRLSKKAKVFVLQSLRIFSLKTHSIICTRRNSLSLYLRTKMVVNSSFCFSDHKQVCLNARHFAYNAVNFSNSILAERLFVIGLYRS